MHRRRLQTVLLALGAACCLAADSDSSIKSSTAKQARASFDRSLSAAQAAYDRAVAGATAKYLLALKAAKLKATKSGDLAEAVAIEKEQKRLETGDHSGDPMAGASFKLARGSVWSFMPGGRWASNDTGTGGQWGRVTDDLYVLSFHDAPMNIDLIQLQPDGSMKWWNTSLRGKANVAQRVK